MTLGMKIQALRKSQNLTQKELANAIGVTTGAIAEWESDEAVPDLSALVKLCKVLSVSTDVLLSEITQETSSALIIEEESEVVKEPNLKKRRKTLWAVLAAMTCAIVVAAILFFGKASVPFSQNTSAIEAADASVVTIFCYGYDGKLTATGSGFVAFDSKTIVTNYHVIASAYTCKISTNQDFSYDVSDVLCYSEEQDIAILQLAEDTELKPLVLGDSTSIKKGENVVAIGSPLGIQNTVSTGVLSGRLMEANMYVLQFTAPISSGSSGGALLDDNGNLIGITYASYIDGQNLNLAIPAELAVKLYQNKGIVLNLSKLYMINHPYAVYLHGYKDIPTVTLDDLKYNPEKYNEKIIRLSIYVSSKGDTSDKDWKHDEWYLAEKDNVSMNFEYDDYIAHEGISEIAYQKCPVIVCYTKNLCSKYVDYSVAPGDRIQVVAYFEYYHKELSYENASIESILIWKE